MARKKQNPNAAFVLFDVLYEDGTRSSNRKVPSGELGGLDGDAPARTIIEAQDQQVAAQSGQRRAKIKTLTRAAVR